MDELPAHDWREHEQLLVSKSDPFPAHRWLINGGSSAEPWRVRGAILSQ